MIIFLIALFLLVVRLIAEVLDDPSSAEKRRRAGRLGVLAVAIAVAGIWIAAAPWPLSGAAPILVFAVPVLAGPIVRHVLIPMGWVRPAFHLTRLVPLVATEDRVGTRALAGARALLRQRTVSYDDVEWLRARLVEAPLRGAGVCAHGFILAARGETAAAREVLASVATIDARALPESASKLAAEWLVADAFVRGDLRTAIEIGRSRSSGFMVWLMGGVAERLAGDPLAPGNAGLIMRWLLARSRVATWPIVQRALGERRSEAQLMLAPAADEIAAPGPGDDDWTFAARAHAVAVLRGGSALARAASAWDRLLLDGSAERRLRQRAQELGGTGNGALSALREVLEEDVAAILRAGGAAATAEPGGLLDSAAKRLREQLLGEIELACAAIKRRSERTALPALDEWREWSSLRASVERAVALGGEDLRRVAFPTVNSALGNHAAWLYNVLGEKALANAMFAWLHAEAVALEDERASALHAKNVSCGV